MSKVLHIKRPELLSMLPKESVGAEVGVGRGTFSEKIIDVVNPVKLYLIDTWRFWDHKHYGERYEALEYIGGGGTPALQDSFHQGALSKFAKEIESGQVEVMRMPSVQALNRFETGCEIDWIYLDGCHLYETVIAELFCSNRVVKSGGLIGGHDYYDDPRWEDGVRIAVDEFVATGLCEVIAMGNHPKISGCTDYLLRNK